VRHQLARPRPGPAAAAGRLSGLPRAERLLPGVWHDGVNNAESDRSRTSIEAGHGVKVEHSVIVNRSPEELYRYWRDFAQLPRIMRHLEEVRVMNDRRSHWVAKAPLGLRVEWDAEVITDKPGEVIGWRSLPGADVDTAGSVHFVPAGAGRGTEVRVILKYDPPAGKVGATVARWLGESPEVQLREDLDNFKRTMEGSQGQVSGRQMAGATA